MSSCSRPPLEVADVLPDVILTDISMPVMDGVSFARELARSAKTADIPVFALTAHTLEEDLTSFAEAGMLGVIAKPVTPDALQVLFNQAETISADQLDLHTEQTETELLDWTVIDGLKKETGEEVTVRLMQVFKEDTLKRGELIAEAVASSDCESLERETHTLGSSAGQFGAPALHDLCRRVENLLRQGQQKQGLKEAEDIQPLISQVVQAVEAVF